MNRSFYFDLHLHTVLSPCADLSMSPTLILPKLIQFSISLIAITDHNSVLNFPAFIDFPGQGVTVIPGMELTTREEVHLLAFFPNYSVALQFQALVDSLRQNIPNNPDLFGNQLIINEKEEIVAEEKILLAQAIAISIEDAVKIIHELHGLAIPSHVDRHRFSITSQLGFIPPSLPIDGVEITRASAADSYASRYPIIISSDAHSLSMLRPCPIRLEAPNATFYDLSLGLKNAEGRRIVLV